MNSRAIDKTLYYFTRTYPFGDSPLWKKNELEVLRGHFSKIVVVPLTFGGCHEPRNTVEGIEYRDPVLDDEHTRLNRTLKEKILITAGLFGTPVMRRLAGEVLSPKTLFSSSRLAALLRSTYELALFQKNAALSELFAGMSKDDSVLYFYWGIGQVNALLLMREAEVPFAACRFHGWDLYEERHDSGYIPYRTQLLKLLDLLLPCSEHGAEYLRSRAGVSDSKVVVARLGTCSGGRSNSSPDRTLRIVSCARVVAVKRLDLLCEALMKTAIPIRWTHIGDGELMSMVRSYVDQFPPNVEADLRGSVPAAEVPKTLAREPFDLFVNTSSSEGVPVSIMEAFAAGIPAVATDVGGTGEVVDDSVGKLVPATIRSEELADVFEEFYSLEVPEKLRLRDAAFQRFKERCDAKMNAESLAQSLTWSTLRDSAIM